MGVFIVTFYSSGHCMAWGNVLLMWELSCKATVQTSRHSVGSTWGKQLLARSSPSSKCESFCTRTLLPTEVDWISDCGAKATGEEGLWWWQKAERGASTGTSTICAQWCEQLGWEIIGVMGRTKTNQAKLCWFWALCHEVIHQCTMSW